MENPEEAFGSWFLVLNLAKSTLWPFGSESWCKISLFLFLPVKSAFQVKVKLKNNNTESRRYWEEYEKGEFLYRSGGKIDPSSHYGKEHGYFLKKQKQKNRIPVRSSSATFGFTPKRDKIISSRRHLLYNVYCNHVHSNQIMKSIKMSSELI